MNDSPLKAACSSNEAEGPPWTANARPARVRRATGWAEGAALAAEGAYRPAGRPTTAAADADAQAEATPHTAMVGAARAERASVLAEPGGIFPKEIDSGSTRPRLASRTRPSPGIDFLRNYGLCLISAFWR